MKMIISPAKKLDFDGKVSVKRSSLPRFLKESQQLIDVLRSYSFSEISQLMKLSEKLTKLNRERYENFSLPLSKEKARQALFAFKGDTYIGLAPEDFTPREIQFSQKNLRILSGLYGLLRPLDLMAPYRLEMGTKLPCGGRKNLYEFWKAKLSESLARELKRDGDLALINLASKEYFSALSFSDLKVPIVTCHFKQEKGGKYKVIGMKAKRARGMMARYIVKGALERPKDLKEFSQGGYQFSPKDSTETDFIFNLREG